MDGPTCASRAGLTTARLLRGRPLDPVGREVDLDGERVELADEEREPLLGVPAAN